VLAGDDVEQPVLLAVVLQALGAGQHGVVVGEDRGGPAVDRPHPGHQAVGWGPLDQLGDRPAAALGGDDQRAVLDEAAGVAQVLDVLAGGALAGAAAALDGLGAGGVEPDPVAIDHLGQVGPRPVAGGRRHLRGLLPLVDHRCVCRGDDRQQISPLDRVAGDDRHRPHDAGVARLDDVLHLHRLDDDHRARHAHRLAGGGGDPHDRSLER
jgi:hypothetical protein